MGGSPLVLDLVGVLLVVDLDSSGVSSALSSLTERKPPQLHSIPSE